ncbi:MAG TPA: hypothetical protein PKK13_12975 [Spirochaetota bacterium]|nr:MAG: hypothetical protein BWX91_00550 [Spirochaetes bacterium ADurb.Bin133]HNZ28129.1 hypothetical protein [Spirochaetota bacterium]
MNKNKKIAMLFLIIASLVGALLLTSCAADLQGKDKNSKLLKIEFSIGRLGGALSTAKVNEINDIPGNLSSFEFRPIASPASKIEVNSSTSGLIDYLGNLNWRVNVKDAELNTFDINVTSESGEVNAYSFKVNTALTINSFSIELSGRWKDAVVEETDNRDKMISPAGDIDVPMEISAENWSSFLASEKAFLNRYYEAISGGVGYRFKQTNKYNDWVSIARFFNGEFAAYGAIKDNKFAKGLKISSTIRIDLSNDVSVAKLKNALTKFEYVGDTIYIEGNKPVSESVSVQESGVSRVNFFRDSEVDSSADAIAVAVYKNSVVYSLKSIDGTVKKYRVYANYENTTNYTEKEIYQHIAVTPFGITFIITVDDPNDDNYYVRGDSNFLKSQFNISASDTGNASWNTSLGDMGKMKLLSGKWRGKYLRGFNIYKPNDAKYNKMCFLAVYKDIGNVNNAVSKGELPYKDNILWGRYKSSCDFAQSDYIIFPQLYARGDISGVIFEARQEMELVNVGTDSNGKKVYYTNSLACVDIPAGDELATTYNDNKFASSESAGLSVSRWKYGAGDTADANAWFLNGAFDFCPLVDNAAVEYGVWESTIAKESGPNFGNVFTTGKHYVFMLKDPVGSSPKAKIIESDTAIVVSQSDIDD